MQPLKESFGFFPHRCGRSELWKKWTQKTIYNKRMALELREEKGREGGKWGRGRGKLEGDRGEVGRRKGGVGRERERGLEKSSY